MVIGGQAVLIYGEPRLTRDIDITLGVDIDRLPIISRILKKIHLFPLPKNVEPFVRKTRVLPTEHRKSGVRVDFIFSFSSYEQNAIARARSIRFGGVMISYASPEDVIIHKVFAGRPRDLEDVKGILLRQSGLDQRYILSRLKSFESVAGRDLVKQYQYTRKKVR